jgi:HK97 family phage prohead protease
MEKEIRTFNPTDTEVRATRRGRTIEGYGIVFGKESRDLGGFTEVISPEAIKGVIERSDVLALLNHDENRGVLARATNGAGTLELTVDDFGVKYRFDAPDTVLGDEVLSGVRRGDIRTSSFAFKVASEGDNWEKTDGKWKRTINQFDEIYDMSPVYREAYADTTVAVRNLVEIQTNEASKKIADLEEELRKSKLPPSDSTDVLKADIPEVKPEDLTDYFKELRNKIPKK